MSDAPAGGTVLTSDKLLLSEPNIEGGLLETSRTLANPGTLTARTLDYLRASVSPNTRRAYHADLRHYLQWGGTIPSSVELVAGYLASQAGVLSIATLARRLVTIGRAHTSLGLPSPTSSDLVRLTMRGIRRKHGRPQRQVAAAVKSDILAMLAPLGDNLRDKRDRALLLIGFAGAFRRSELCAISCTDIRICGHGAMITISRSKTDQFGHGRRVVIPYGRDGACPVKALTDWLLASGIVDGPVFRGVSRYGRVAVRALSGEAVALIVKKRAAAAGLDQRRYAGHSLRAGFATSAAAAGLASWKIRKQTGHASDAMLERYIREGDLLKDTETAAVL